jgi:hydroxymethylglutaryl-CoA synthase
MYIAVLLTDIHARNLKREETYANRDLEGALKKIAEPVYESRTKPSSLLPVELGICLLILCEFVGWLKFIVLNLMLGNLYCGSLYAGLLSLLHSKGDALLDKRVMLFSYGSGLAATMFTLLVNQPLTACSYLFAPFDIFRIS